MPPATVIVCLRAVGSMDGRIAGGDRDSKPINWVTRDNRDYRAYGVVYRVFTMVCVVACLRLALDRVRRTVPIAVVPGMSGLLQKTSTLEPNKRHQSRFGP